MNCIRGVLSGLTVIFSLCILGCGVGREDGKELGACYPNGTCNTGLRCLSNICVFDGDVTEIPIDGDMVLIPAGSFWMGCNETADFDCAPDEFPYHKVTITKYYMDKTEVTVEAFQKCVDEGVCNHRMDNCRYNNGQNWVNGVLPSEYKGINQPMVCVTWTQAQEYCNWAGKRLPSEAEWEKAARGTDGRKYPWGHEKLSCDYAAWGDGSGCGKGEGAWSVCNKSPTGDSPYGLCDMAGNVSEWVSDWYSSDYYSSSPTTNPTGPNDGSERVCRGGSFNDDYTPYFRASSRNHANPPEYAYCALGFRCAKSQ